VLYCWFTGIPFKVPFKVPFQGTLTCRHLLYLRQTFLKIPPNVQKRVINQPNHKRVIISASEKGSCFGGGGGHFCESKGSLTSCVYIVNMLLWSCGYNTLTPSPRLPYARRGYLHFSSILRFCHQKMSFWPQNILPKAISPKIKSVEIPDIFPR
jgi:hypothetical protein